MTEAELRELDLWIADKFMGWILDSGSDERFPSWNDSRGVPHYWSTPVWQLASGAQDFRPSTLPAAFALVKREIERRGWGWRCERDMDSTLAFKFDLFIPKGHPGEMVDALTAYGETEEIAGCLAVRGVLESSS